MEATGTYLAIKRNRNGCVKKKKKNFNMHIKLMAKND